MYVLRVSLHSNMVLFKCNRRPKPYQISHFTFQYGSIQIWYYRSSPKLQLLYIPIWFYSNRFWKWKWEYINNLYIPIWFYSNPRRSAPLRYASRLYIPIWFYSNTRQKIKKISEKLLYIPIWFYSNALDIILSGTKYTFTFQYGSIQIVCFCG